MCPATAVQVVGPTLFLASRPPPGPEAPHAAPTPEAASPRPQHLAGPEAPPPSRTVVPTAPSSQRDLWPQPSCHDLSRPGPLPSLAPRPSLVPTCPSTPADMPASSFSPFSPGSSCFQPDSEPPSLLLPGGPPGCQDPISSTHRSPSPGGPSCRQTAGVRPVPMSCAYVPTAWHPPRTWASAFFLLIPGEPDKAWLADPSCGQPVPPNGCLCFSGRGQSGERTCSPGRVF